MRLSLAFLAAATAGCAADPLRGEWESAPAVDRRLSEIFASAASAFQERRYGKAIGHCDDALAIQPDFDAARELKEYSEKARHTDDPFGTMAARVKAWNSLTCVERGTIPARRRAP